MYQVGGDQMKSKIGQVLKIYSFGNPFGLLVTQDILSSGPLRQKGN
jgi:hypothetical protein